VVAVNQPKQGRTKRRDRYAWYVVAVSLEQTKRFLQVLWFLPVLLGLEQENVWINSMEVTTEIAHLKKYLKDSTTLYFCRPHFTRVPTKHTSLLYHDRPSTTAVWTILG
jgi:hypothetical protein